MVGDPSFLIDHITSFTDLLNFNQKMKKSVREKLKIFSALIRSKIFSNVDEHVFFFQAFYTYIKNDISCKSLLNILSCVKLSTFA